MLCRFGWICILIKQEMRPFIQINIIEASYNKTKMSSIKTAVRVRPFLTSEIQQHYRNTRLTFNQQRKQVAVKDESTAQKKTFRFDFLLPQESTQEDVYSQCGVQELINKALQGYHSTIFAYGQTGSGKTHTMQGEESPQQPGALNGLIPKITRNLFEKIAKFKGSRSYTISVSFLQIYSEKIYDLLNPSSLNNRTLSLNSTQIEGLRLRWSKDEQFTVQNLFLFECKTQAELLRYFQNGLKNRINATHKLNLQSSRSHSILSIRIQSFDLNDPSHLRSSRIQLVDLAGSQRLSMTGTEGKLAKESIDINKSLFTLRQVINILSQNSRAKKQEKVYVPYRDSKLTSILKQSIGGNSYCLMIACVNPNDMFLQENISTLTYATKASFITNCPVVNDDPRLKAIQELKKQVRQLSQQLDKANKHIEFLSTLNERFEQKGQLKNQKSSQSPRKQKKQQQKSEQSQLPMPSFKKSNNNWDSTISQRLIQSINMVRQLLKSNKQLRQKLQGANRFIDEKDVQIFELTKQNQLLKEGSNPEQLQNLNNKPNSNQSKRLSFKISSSLPKQTSLIQQIRQQPSSLKPMIAPGISLDLNKLYLNEKGIDSAPTNFNKRLTSTSQERRASYSRGGGVEEDRHAITAKFSKRGWLGRQIEGNKFLSFYEDLKS